MLKKNSMKIAKKYIEQKKFQSLTDTLSTNFIYMSGSIMEGFGNSESDIDLFVVSKDLPKIEAIDNYLEGIDGNRFIFENKIIITNSYDGVDFDIEFHKIDDVDMYVYNLNNHLLKENDYYLDFLHRMKFGFPLLKEKNFNNYIQKVQFSNLNYVKARKYSTYFPIKVTDILGAYKEKDFQTSFFMSWFLLEESIDTYLFLLGETNPNKKWRIKKIKNLKKKNIAQSEELLIILENTFNKLSLEDIESLKQKTTQILKECQKLNTRIQGELRND